MPANITDLLTRDETADGPVLAARGDWIIANAAMLDEALDPIARLAPKSLTLDLSDLETLDTAGAWLLHRTVTALRESGTDVDITGEQPVHRGLIDEVARSYKPCEIAPHPRNHILEIVENVGETTVAIWRGMVSGLSFLGNLTAVAGQVGTVPRRFRLTSMVFHVEEVGLNALPIVGLVSFLIGVVLAYQGAVQLRQLGAEIFVVDLIAVAVLRELGVLLTAIMIAGRSGSAFTAQLGTMKVNEEVDALRSLGLDPLEVLVLPRCIALVISLPLLTFFADLMGLLGGGLMAWIELDIGPAVFLERLRDAVSPSSFWVGIVKAPVFAVIIAVIGCYEGLQVRGSAEAVGRHTTRAVVESVFVVIVADALFSVFFDLIGV